MGVGGRARRNAERESSLRGAESLTPDSYGMKERRHQPLRSPHAAGARRLARSRLGDGARGLEPKPTRQTGVCPAKQTVTRRKGQSRAGEPSRSFGGKGNQAAAPCDRRKTGLRVVGGGTGRYGVSPLEWVAPHEVGARERPFPPKNPIFRL